MRYGFMISVANAVIITLPLMAGVASAEPPLVVAQASPAAIPAAPSVQGVTSTEIKFGMTAPFSGSSKEYGVQLRTGVQTAFKIVNDAGGIAGRKLTLATADDGYDPARTLDAAKQLYEKDQIFGYLGSFGTATAAVSLPYALSHRALFFAPYTGGGAVRHDPPDRYVFNYRPSYAEETGAALRYLVKVRRIRPEQLAHRGGMVDADVEVGVVADLHG